LDKDLIVPYEKVARLLKLDERDVEMDTLLVESSNEWVTLITDRQIIARDAVDVDVCSDGTLAVKEWPIQTVSGILDITTQVPIECTPIFGISDTSHIIHIDSKYDGQKLGVVYRAGYEVEDVPSIIVEAVIKLFFHKKANMTLEKLGTGDGDTYANTKHTYDEVMLMLEPFIRKGV